MGRDSLFILAKVPAVQHPDCMRSGGTFPDTGMDAPFHLTSPHLIHISEGITLHSANLTIHLNQIVKCTVAAKKVSELPDSATRMQKMVVLVCPEHR